MKTGDYRNRDLVWKGDALYRPGSRSPVLTIEQDAGYPTMWRVRLADGSLTDMVNRTRARDAARVLVLAMLNERAAA